MNTEKQKILVIDDEQGIREQFYWSLRDEYDVLLAETSSEAVEQVKQENPAVILLDLTLNPEGNADDGLTLFEQLQLLTQTAKVIIMTGNKKKALGVRAVQMGAFDFYHKPIDLEEIRIIIKRALQIRTLELEVGHRAEDIADTGDYEIVGNCRQLLDAYEIVKRVSPTDTTVLITGESGTGKELVARAIHRQSLRSEHPCRVINCGAIPENLLESELFGHEKGAFTGAHCMRKGKFELANHGTIFLDEIGELSVNLQVKLLRFLQEKQIERVGGSVPIQLDVRIIAATNRNLELEASAGVFRADLFYRLSVITIHLPPLRNRGKDIMLLANHFLKKYCQEFRKPMRTFSPVAKRIIENYDWPGNIRELENKVKRAVIMSQGAIILPEDLNLNYQPGKSEMSSLRRKVAQFEEECIKEALYRNGGNISRTARELSVNRTTFYDMLHKYNIDHKKFYHNRKKIGH